jgi:hypothetical protein
MNQEQRADQKILSQKLVMISASYVTIFWYAIILLLLISMQDNFTRTNDVIIGFGIGAIISVVSSTFIIRKALENQINFSYTLVKLAIAHIPAIIGLVYAYLIIAGDILPS